VKQFAARGTLREHVVPPQLDAVTLRLI
jgi:hypothetical protein